MKTKKCSYPDCENDRLKKPGNTNLHFKYCRAHMIQSTLSKVKEDMQKDKDGLEKARKTLKKRTAKDVFYSSSAWRNFSHYILLKYADDDLMVRCSTNPNVEMKVNDKEMHVGHWIPVFESNSSNYSTCLDERNVGPQSSQQNRHLHGNPEEMAKWIDKTHGKGTTNILLQLKKLPLKLDKYDLAEVGKIYRQKLNDELNRRGIKDPWKN